MSLVVLVIPAIALRVAMRFLYEHRSLGSLDSMHTLLSQMSILMFIMAAMGVVIGAWVVVIPLLLAIVMVTLMVVTRKRQAEHFALINSLGTAVQHGIPLSECARAFADETLGDTGVRAMALAEAIEYGQPLPRAVRSAKLWMGTATRLAIRLGDRLGLLGAAMRQQIADAQSVELAIRRAVGDLYYLVNLILCFFVINTFMMLKIIPVFQKMFEEFGLKLPAMTLVVINLSKWYVMRGWFLTAPFMLLVPWIFIIGFLAYIGWMPRDLPLVWRLFRRYDGALIMRGLALAVRRGVPMPEAMRMIAEEFPMRIVGRRLLIAAEKAAAGVDWISALRKEGLINRTDAALLASASRVGNLDWALEEIAESTMRRQVYWLQSAVSVLFPFTLLAVGMVVCFFVVGLFLPLISLIQGLS
jgi:type II secretory pathway component PulF